MTSIHSETDDARRGSFRFPPRDSLPPDVLVPRLPLLGTSWYKHGFFYWLRRAGISTGLGLVLIVYLAMIEGVLQALAKPGTSTYWTLVAVEVVFTVVSGVLMFRHLWHLGVSGRSARAGSSSYGRAGAGVGALAASVGGVLAGVIALCSVISSGIALAAFALWIVPVPPAEQGARLLLAEQLQVRRDRQQFLRRYSSHRRRKR